MKCCASDVIKDAIKWIGYHEKASNKNLESYTANSGCANYTIFADTIDKKYPTLFNGKKNGFAYCAIFVHYVFIELYGLDKTRELLSLPEKNSASAGVTYLYAYMKKAKKVGNMPKIGALIIFGKKENDLKHVGFVEKFDSKYVYTIEGNTSNQVARRKYLRTDCNIFGYCYPSYDEEVLPIKSNEDISFKGNIEINTDSKNINKSVMTDGRVNCSSLNVRTWAGANNPQLKTIPMITKDTIIGVCDAIASSNGDKWYYILINNKTYGFVNSKYIDLLTTNTIGESEGPIDNFNVAETR